MGAFVMVAILLSFIPFVSVQSFSIRPFTIQAVPSGRKTSITPCHSASTYLQMSLTPFDYARKNIRLPLLVDISESDGQPLYDVPLPNSHLPPELTTASLYELKLDVPIHRSVIQEAISSAKMSGSSPIVEEGCCYGHVVFTPDNSDDLVGSIGCASEILIGAHTAMKERDPAMDSDDSGPYMVLARGSYRFRVKEIVKSIPYPVAIVDEILDENVQGSAETGDEDDGDIYDTLEPRELIKQIFQSLDTILTSQAEAAATPLSPLEKSILEDASSSNSMAQAMQMGFDAEERIAVFQTFTMSLLDICPGEKDRMFAVAMIAGELASLPVDLRVKMLVTTDGVARLRMVLRELSSMLSMDSARKITKSISLSSGSGEAGGIDIDTNPQSLQEAEDAKKDLQLGTPKLPPWADQIQKGVRIEYFWNEELEWCLGTVDEDPVKIMDEIILTIKFDDDGSIHKLPFRGDEKARWRPPKGSTGAFD